MNNEKFSANNIMLHFFSKLNIIELQVVFNNMRFEMDSKRTVLSMVAIFLGFKQATENRQTKLLLFSSEKGKDANSLSSENYLEKPLARSFFV